MVVDLLNAAGEWERSLPEHQHYGRRAVLATLCIAGPRISELTNRREPGSTYTAAASGSALIWQLMRFPDEPDERRPGRAFESKD